MSSNSKTSPNTKASKSSKNDTEDRDINKTINSSSESANEDEVINNSEPKNKVNKMKNNSKRSHNKKTKSSSESDDNEDEVKNYSGHKNKVFKFQELEEGKKYLVTEFKLTKSNYGNSYIMKLINTSDRSELQAWSSKKINEYIEDKNFKKNPKKFSFKVKRIKTGDYAGFLYAEIDDSNNGWTKLK